MVCESRAVGVCEGKAIPAGWSQLRYSSTWNGTGEAAQGRKAPALGACLLLPRVCQVHVHLCQ